MKYNDKVKLALETIEEAVDRKIMKEGDAFAKIDSAVSKAVDFPSERELRDFRGSKDAPKSGLHDTTKSSMQSLMQSLSGAMKGSNSDFETIKTQMKAVDAQLKAEKARQAIHGEYQKKLGEVEKEFATVPAKDKKTAPVKAPAKAAEKSAPAKAKKEEVKPADKKGMKPSNKKKMELDEADDENPCWDGYKKLGMKQKGGKSVPNCVPNKK